MQGWAAATAAASSIRSAARPVGQYVAATGGGHHGAHQCLQQPRCLFHNAASCSLELRARELRTRARRLVRTRRALGARRLTSRRASQAWSKIMDFIRCTGNDSRRGEPGRCSTRMRHSLLRRTTYSMRVLSAGAVPLPTCDAPMVRVCGMWAPRCTHEGNEERLRLDLRDVQRA